ncbi:MAG: hypothetical protein AAF725_10715 [Acidobacteriota bacterium]
MLKIQPTTLRRLLLAAACLLALAALAFMASVRTPLEHVWADEGTYLAMAESLVLDGDLLFDERDLERVEKFEPHQGRAYLILQRTEAGIAYSKPIVLALFAAPFYALAGNAGLVALNALALAIALFLAAAALRALAARRGDDPSLADAALLTWTLAATVLPYVFWRMSDLLQLSLVLAGLALTLGHSRGGARRGPIAWRGAPWLGTALITLALPMRLSNGALALIPILDALLRRRFRRAAGYALTAAAVAGGMALLSLQMTGAPDPYRAERTSFLPASGYPAGAEAERIAERFGEAPAAHVSGMADPRNVLYGAGYFWVGRHTGLLFYFPAVLFLAIHAARRRDASTWACALPLAISLAFFMVFKPENYFGGETFLGNRYFLPIYPLLLFLPARLPPVRLLATTWAVALLVYGSAAFSVLRLGQLTAPGDAGGAATVAVHRGNQSHAHAGVFRLLPYESTAQSLAGRQDRYWSRHFLRFTEPYAHIGDRHLTLVAGRPSTEVLIAHWQDPRPLRLEVSAGAEEARLEIADWRGSQTFEVGRGLAGAVGVDFQPSRPWRRHGFWFEESLYWAHALRLRLIAPEGSTARVVYLGDPSAHEEAFAYSLLKAELPGAAAAGSTSAVRVEVRNESGALWEPRDVVAVNLSHRLWLGDRLIAEDRWPLESRVAPGESVERTLEIAWPEAPGDYRLELDLVQEHVAWFQDRLGSPLASGTVRVEPAAP